LRHDADVAAGSFGCNLLLRPIALDNSARGVLISMLYQPIEPGSRRVQLFYGPGTVGRVVFADAVFGGEWRRLLGLMDDGGGLMRGKVVLGLLEKSPHPVFDLRSRNVGLTSARLYLAGGQVCAWLLIIGHWRLAHEVFFDGLEAFILF
jgi:hypothetical protein